MSAGIAAGAPTSSRAYCQGQDFTWQQGVSLATGGDAMAAAAPRRPRKGQEGRAVAWGGRKPAEPGKGHRAGPTARLAG